MEAIAMSNKAWGGRFEVQPEEWVDDFNASITFDQTLIDQDIEGKDCACNYACESRHY